MCTLIAALGQVPGWPLVIAANRDEALDRPATPPLRWEGPTPFLAPRDEQAGGTWLGLTASGLFVGITNRFRAGRDPARRSRGQLVVDALRLGSVEAIHRHLAALDVTRYNAFHLLYADAQRGGLSWSDGQQLHQQTLGPGLHVVTERSFGLGEEGRLERIRSTWSGLDLARVGPHAFVPLLTQHARLSPFDGTCVHAPLVNYGTRSSLVLMLGEHVREGRMLWAEGRPCTATFTDQSGMLAGLAPGA